MTVFKLLICRNWSVAQIKCGKHPTKLVVTTSDAAGTYTEQLGVFFILEQQSNHQGGLWATKFILTIYMCVCFSICYNVSIDYHVVQCMQVFFKCKKPEIKMDHCVVLCNLIIYFILFNHCVICIIYFSIKCKWGFAAYVKYVAVYVVFHCMYTIFWNVIECVGARKPLQTLNVDVFYKL